MKSAVLEGLDVPPGDLRYLTRPQSESDSAVRASVASFLSEIYHSVAETLPDFRDDTYDESIELEVAAEEDADPYAELLEKPEILLKQKKKETKQKPRKNKGSVKLNQGRAIQIDGTDEQGRDARWLPPGQLKDYCEQYRQRYRESTFKCASFTLFWRVA